jgi:hypothetical protein
MYEVDNQDCVNELKGVPHSSVGAPFPFVMSDERVTFLTYYVENTPEDWDSAIVRMMDSATNGEPVALVRFKQCHAHLFGPSSEEFFSRHPLANRGLKPYGAYVVEDSSWLRWLEGMDQVHAHPHKLSYFSLLKHFIFAFHNSTFECLAEEMDISVYQGPIRMVVPQMFKLLEYKPS